MAAGVSFFCHFLLLLSTIVVLISPLTFSASDEEALLKLKKSLTNANNALDSWVPGSSPCNGTRGGTWKGLLCDGGVVRGLRLEGMGLSGNIDIDALAEIRGLRFLSLANNSFTDIFPGINRLGALRALFLSMNLFSGEIPPEYFDRMGSLKRVYLSYNQFTGYVPASLSRLSNLIDLHLDNNQFSGPIPAFNGSTLKTFNVSNNHLEGEIPPTLSKFNVSSFAGNPGLCGEKVGVECIKVAEGRNSTGQKIAAAMVMLGILVFLGIISFAVWWKTEKEKDLNVMRRGMSNPSVEVRISMLAKRKERLRSLGSSCKDINIGDANGVVSELVMVNAGKGVFGLTDLMKASAEVLGNGSLGSSYKVIMDNGVMLVVKRLRHMNALGKDAFDAGVKRLGNLRHPNVSPPLAYHYRREEKLFVLEYLPKGSLLYHLHGKPQGDDGESSAKLDWPARLKIVLGIAEGLEYLHTHLPSLDVPHGNLKSSNVLLGPDNHPFLSDYGFRPLVDIDGLQGLFAYQTPEAVQQKTVSPKSDVYCLGIIILEILTGELPSQYFNDGNGGIDVVQWVASAFAEGRQAELLDIGIEGCRNSVGSMEKLLRVGALCTEASPEQRLDIKEVIRMIKEIQAE